MSVQTCFKRFELKYKLSHAQYHALYEHMAKYMKIDEYCRHKISNIYFDTEDYRIIRHSLEKPKYKEKLRIRIYGEPENNSNAFIELKKKFDGVVYKRRISIPQEKALDCLRNNCLTNNDIDDIAANSVQIKKEIDYFAQSYNNLKAKVYLAYEREAYFSLEDSNFRMTFDFNIKMRNNHVSFYASDEDISVIENDIVLLEVKTLYGLPFWFIDFLNQNKIYATSFSKYGTAYTSHILPSNLSLQAI